METFIITAVTFVAVSFANLTQAQGTLYVSNLGELDNGSPTPLDSATAWAAEFTTGTNSAGYNLASIQVAQSNVLGSSSAFVGLSLYADNGGQPGSSLGALTGLDSPNPATAAIDTFIASGITLAAQTPYWVVVTEPDVNKFWYRAADSDYTSEDGWSINSVYAQYNGSTWLTGSSNPSQFAVNAEPAPEPQTVGVFILGLLFLCRGKQLSVLKL